MTVTPPAAVELDGIELWVGHLDAARRVLSSAFGFEPRDAVYGRPGTDDRTDVLGCGDVDVVLRQGRSPGSPTARHVQVHGDTVGDVALACADPRAVAERARALGLDVFGDERQPTVDLLGGRTVCHSLRASRPGRGGAQGNGSGTGFTGIDHVAYCLPWGSAEQVARTYEDVFGLERVDVGESEEVGGDVVGMRSTVLRSAGGFTVVLTEPSTQAGTGQTQRFIDAHAGPGVQHVAIACDDLVGTVERLRARGVEFLPVPAEYFDRAEERLGDAPVPWDDLRRLEILIDRDDQGLLFQLFTRPLTGRPTFFVELIQRAGATGFGANNVRALFAAVQASIGG